MTTSETVHPAETLPDDVPIVPSKPEPEPAEPALAQPYASVEDMVLRFGEAKLTQLTDRTMPPVRKPDPAIIGTALADATEMVDGYAASRYRTPLEPVPAPVRKWTADIAFYYLHTASPVPESVRKAFEDALSGLKDMAKGVIVFQSEGILAEATPHSGVFAYLPERLFTADSLKGF